MGGPSHPFSQIHFPDLVAAKLCWVSINSTTRVLPALSVNEHVCLCKYNFQLDFSANYNSLTKVS